MRIVNGQGGCGVGVGGPGPGEVRPAALQREC